MTSLNTRATRSRYSSPAQPQNGNQDSASKNSAGQGSRTFMQRWLEPSVQSKPSFEEAGLMRFGVLESMAPLGALPKAKKAPNEGSSSGGGGGPVRRIILRPSGASAANAAQDATPKAPVEAASSPPPAHAAQPVKSSPPRRRSLAVAKDAEDDGDYDPKGAPRRRQSGRVSLSRKTRRASASTSVATGRRGSVSASASAPAPAPAPAPAAKDPLTPTPKRVREPKKFKEASEESLLELKENVAMETEERGFVDKVIEAAVDEALKHYRYPTAWALRTLYDDKADDPKFMTMIGDVFSQTADAATMDDFSQQIEERKREGKKDNQGCYYFIPPSTNSRFTPHKPKTAPYGHLLHFTEEDEEDEEEEDEERIESEGEEEKEEEEEEEMETQEQKGSNKKKKKTKAKKGREEQGGEPESEARAAKKAKTSHHRDTPRKSAKNSVNSEFKTPSRKRARRESGSSDSSLSSAMSLSSPEVTLASLSPTFRGGATGPESDDAPKSRPITTRGKSLASKQNKNRSNSSESNSPPNHHPFPIKSKSNTPAADATMPGRIAAAQLFPNLATKGSKAAKNGAKTPVPEDGDAFWDRRNDARRVTNSADALESSVRRGDEPQVATPVRKTRRTRQSLAAAPISTRSTRSASKRSHDEVDSTISPVALSFVREGSSRTGSRAATPTTLRPTKKQRTGLRVKSSPVKKKGGTAAGFPRPTGEASSSSANGATKEQTADNDEYCSACGNAGDVVCCDGCPRSFHFECVDMVQSEDLPDEWFCNECLFKKYPSRVAVHRGVFAAALNNLEKSIPRAFSLPRKLQTRFEGVRAGADGDYEDVISSRTVKKKNGYDELPDFFKQRDDGQAVLCHDCQKPATDVRAIIPCSQCPLYWHIDCLDPPLAVPPVLKNWRCPVHVDEILTQAPPLAPAHRFRKVKGSQAITPALPRGIRNNGHIEVDWSDDTEIRDDSGWPDSASFGREYKLPAKSIVLDFIEQLRRQGAGHCSRPDEGKWMPTTPPASNAPGPGHQLLSSGAVLEREVNEMQASLILTSLKQEKSQDIGQLTSALMMAVDDNILSLMAKGNADNMAVGKLTADDKLSLRALLAQMDAMSSRIRHVLGEDVSCSTAVPRLAQAPTPDALSPEPSVSDLHDKPDVTLPITEPTPPSTIDQGEGTMELD